MKTRIFTLVASISLLLISASTARATSIGYGSYVAGTINAQGCSFGTTVANPDCLFDGTDPRFWGDWGINTAPYQPFASAGGSRDSAIEHIAGSASLATGDLAVDMWTIAPSSHVNITAFMWDTLTFHFADGGSHLVTANMSGAASTFFDDPFPDGINMAYRFELAPCCPDPNSSSKYLLGDGHIWFTGNGPFNASTSLTVDDGMTVSLISMLWMFGGGNSSGAAFDPITLDIPAGGTFTSASGVFLTETVATPEPTTLLLMGTGLGVAALRRRRVKSHCVRKEEL